jgi:hypothetical protein
VTELTGLVPTDGRAAFTLRIALALGRFAARFEMRPGTEV